MRRLLPLLIVLLAVPLWLGLRGTTPEKSATTGGEAAHAEEAVATRYTCPMHRQVISDKPGQCPICSMDLVAIPAQEPAYQTSKPTLEGQSAAGKDSSDKSDRKVLYWYDPMVPGSKFDRPGKSPFMDMELVPKYADEGGGDAERGGTPVVTLGAETVQKMGVRVEKASRGGVRRSIRSTGVVAENERARREVYTQVEGRVTELKVSAEGDTVRKGQPFYSLYSPELLTLQNDYLAALEAGLKDVAGAARRRMELLGVDAAVIDAVAKRRKALDEIPFAVPADGIVSKLAMRKGSYLTANAMIAAIQDLATIWLDAAVPEGDLPAIQPGAEATVTFAGDPIPHAARVDYVYPAVTPETRTGKVRLVLDNRDGAIRPAAYAEVSFGTQASDALSVPSEAVLRTSGGQHVIVALGEGRFQPREVTTGASGDGRTEITDGLREGEEVVTSAQFLIDSESSLRESLQKLDGGDAPMQDKSTAMPGMGHGR